MATPTVFVSSTFYDLRYVRESIKRFIEQLGYVPILSEEGTVFYDPSTTAAESCLQEVSNADMLVLLIGGRYGMAMPGAEQSVTNAEYQQAVRDKVPVFALVEQGTYSDYGVYLANSSNPEILQGISFPNADSVKIFEFIDSVRSRAENNALIPFRTIADIENYLRAQWAGMLHDYLARGTKEAQVVDTLSVLASVNERVELIASQILKSVGTDMDRAYVALLQAMVESPATANFRSLGVNARPGDILQNETAEQCAAAVGHPLKPYDFGDGERDDEHIISGTGALTEPARRTVENNYGALRRRLLEIVDSFNTSTADVVNYERPGVPTVGG